MANETTASPITPQQRLQIQLQGVQVIKRQAQDYLESLTAYETEIRNRLMTGVHAPETTAGRKPKAAKALGQIGNTAGKPGRKKGGLTPEGRKALSEAAKRRWANRRENGAAESVTTGNTGPEVLPPAGMDAIQ